MDASHDRSLASRAESFFADLLVEKGDAAQTDVEALCAKHPELAGELRELCRQRERMRTLEARAAASIESPLRLAAGLARPSASPGTRLGQFELLRLLGRGGMGEVWEARDHSLQRRLALKLLPAGPSGSGGSAREESRFRREAEAAGRVQHRGIVVVLSAGEIDGRRYIAQELVPGGRTLRDRLDELRRLPEIPADHYRRVASLFLELTAALSAAHEAGIVHRDLKPQNILLAPDGEPKVADFGLARLEGDVSLSRTGEFVGTYYYTSPEQAVPSERAADAQSDVFSLGVTLYECLTLRRPFDGDSVQQVVHAILHADPPDPRAIFSRVPDDLAVICLKALEKRPEARYASMRAFGEDLRRHLANESILARPPSTLRRAEKWVLRHPTLSTALASAAVALVTVSFLFVRSQRARHDAETARADLGEANVELAGARDAALSSAAAMRAQAEELRRESEAREAVIVFLIRLFESANPELPGEADPTARTLLARGVERVRNDPDIDAPVRARLLNTMGMVQEKLGAYAAAKELLLEAEASWKAQGQDEHPEMQHVQCSLAAIEMHLGEFEAAEQRLASLLERTDRDPLFAAEFGWVVCSTLGRVRAEQGRFPEARELLARALELCRENAEASSIDLLSLRSDLALLEFMAGNAARAEELLRSVVADGKDEIAAANPVALEALNNLGLVLTEQERWDDAEKLYLDLIEDLEVRLDAGHPNVFAVRNNLARVWQRQGKHGLAEELYRELIDSSTTAFGRKDPSTLKFLNNLGTCLSGQKRYAEAEAIHREVFAARRELHGPDNPLTLTPQNNLAYDLFMLGRAAEALELQEEVVALSLPDEPSLDGRRKMLEDIRRAVTQPSEETAPRPDPGADGPH